MRLLNLLLAATLAVLAATAAARDPVLAVPDADKARGDLATLVLPETLDIEMLDGLVYPGFKSMFRKGELELRVLPGEREVAVKYNQLFNVSADMHEVVKSKIVVLTFVAEPGKRYRAQHAKFRNVDEARAGTKNFVVTVIDEQGVNRVTAASQVQKNWKGDSTTTSRKDLVNPEAVPPAVVPPAVAPTAAVTVSTLTTVPANPTPATPAAGGGLNAVELLKFTWQNASAADRAAFLEWVKANP